MPSKTTKVSLEALELIRANYHEHAGDFPLQAQLILDTLEQYQSLGCELAKDFVMLSSAQESTLHLYTQDQQITYRPALIKVINELYTKKLSLDKATLAQIKNIIVGDGAPDFDHLYDIQIPEKNILMRYLCFCYGVETKTHDDLLEKLWEVYRSSYEAAQKATQKKGRIDRELSCSDAGLVVILSHKDKWQWLKQKLELLLDTPKGGRESFSEFINTVAGDVSQEARDRFIEMMSRSSNIDWKLEKVLKIFSTHIPQDIAQTLFTTKDALLNRFHILYEAKSMDSIKYLSFVFDLLPKLDITVRTEIINEMTTFLKTRADIYPTSLKCHFLGRINQIKSQYQALSAAEIHAELKEVIQNELEQWTPFMIEDLLTDIAEPDEVAPNDELLDEAISDEESLNREIPHEDTALDMEELTQNTSEDVDLNIDDQVQHLLDTLNNDEALSGVGFWQKIKERIESYAVIVRAASFAEFAPSLAAEDIEDLANRLTDILFNDYCFSNNLPAQLIYRLLETHNSGPYQDSIRVGHQAYDLLTYLPVDRKRELIQRFIQKYEELYQIQYNLGDDDDLVHRKIVALKIITNLVLSLSFSDMQQFEPSMRWKIYSIVAFGEFAECGVETPEHVLNLIYNPDESFEGAKRPAFPLDIRDVVSPQWFQWFGHEESYKEACYPKEPKLTRDELKAFIEKISGYWHLGSKEYARLQSDMFLIASDDELYQQFCVNYRDKLLTDFAEGGHLYSHFNKGDILPVNELYVISMVENARAIYLSQQASIRQEVDASTRLSQSRDGLFATRKALQKESTPPPPPPVVSPK